MTEEQKRLARNAASRAWKKANPAKVTKLYDESNADLGPLNKSPRPASGLTISVQSPPPRG